MNRFAKNNTIYYLFVSALTLETLIPKAFELHIRGVFLTTSF